jgi:hypothetical protein
MADLPELSDSTKRKLTLQWSSHLDANRLTGDHLQWHEWERDRCRRIAAQSPRPGFDWRNELAVDQTGIRQSVAVAEARFKGLWAEYWQVWLSSGSGYESFVCWLEGLKRMVSAEVASVWKGHSTSIDGWYERACRPAVEKVLAELVKGGTNRARDWEILRLEMGANSEASVTTASTVKSETRDSAAARWDAVKISFLSEERVQIWSGAKTETCNYDELGFADRRDEKPNRAWLILKALAQKKGVIKQTSDTEERSWPKVERRMLEVRKALRKHFGISDDPLPFVTGTGYQACFKIELSKSYYT